MTEGIRITDDMLHAFVDGQLDDADMARVEAWLNDNPDRAVEIADWGKQNEAIRALYPAPDAIPEVAIAANISAPPTGVRWGAIAASVLMLGIGAIAGWFGRGATGDDVELVAELVHEAIAAHAVYTVDPHRPVEVAASEEALLIRWLSNRVGAQLSAPDLSAQGFDLVGGRLLSVSEGPAAQFMYQDADGRRITLFAVRGETSRMASFTYQRDGDTNSFYWEDEALRYAIVGDVPRETLNELAVQVFNQLS